MATAVHAEITLIEDVHPKDYVESKLLAQFERKDWLEDVGVVRLIRVMA